MKLIAFCFLLVMTLVSAGAQAQDWDRIFRDGVVESERQWSPSDRRLLNTADLSSAELDMTLVSAFEHYRAGRFKVAVELFSKATWELRDEKSERSAAADYFHAKATEADMQRDPAYARAQQIQALKRENARWTQLAAIDAIISNNLSTSFQVSLHSARLPANYRDDAYASCQRWFERAQSLSRDAPELDDPSFRRVWHKPASCRRSPVPDR